MEINDDTRRYLVDNNLVLYEQRNAMGGKDCYHLCRIDYGIVTQLYYFNISDDDRVRINPVIDDIIDKFKNGNFITEKFINDNPDWIPKLTTALINLMKEKFSISLTKSLYLDSRVKKSRLELNKWETDINIISNTICRNIEGYISTNSPLLFTPNIDAPILSIKDDEPMSVILYYSRGKR
jgi:hypothetical protein